MIKKMLKSWQEVSPTTQTNESNLYDCIKQLHRVIGKRLDKFCEVERINKSDVLHFALADFLEKYDKQLKKQKGLDTLLDT